MDNPVNSTARWVAFVLHHEGRSSIVQLALVSNPPALQDLLGRDGLAVLEYSYFDEPLHRLRLARQRFSASHKARGEVVTKLLADILPGEHSLGTMCVLAFDPKGVLRSVELYSKAAEVANTG